MEDIKMADKKVERKLKNGQKKRLMLALMS